MRSKLYNIVLLFIAAFSIVLFNQTLEVEAATNPYDVDTSVKNGWDTTYGTKTYDMRTGKKLVYDIYSDKFTAGGYKIENRNFGKGSQPYLRFQGWSILLGHYQHTSTNHETYIVAEDTANPSNVKIYGTLPYGSLSATEDVEYNNQGAGVWNQCAASATNKSNIPAENNGCNMTYTNVGFDAYLPMEELFSDISKAKSWKLYIVKRVNSQIVYTPLYLPFEFANKSYYGGDISLTSGVNARTLQMVGTNVIRRTAARSTSGSGSTLGYFTKFNNYTAVTENEAGTAVWFGVRTPENGNATRWASSAYWGFGGVQAKISFVPDDAPPVHVSHSITNSQYINGNDHWVQPDRQVTVRLRQHDKDSGNFRQYLNMYSSSGSPRARLDLDTNTFSQLTSFNHSSLSIDNGQVEEHTPLYSRGAWLVTPKTHGYTYNVRYYYTDRANNSIGYNDTPLRLRVDGVEPAHISSAITGHQYLSGSDYWVKPNTTISMKFRQQDVDSGNRLQYLRLMDGSTIATRNYHLFNLADQYDNNVDITSTHVTVNSATRTHNTTYGDVQWSVTPKLHGKSYAIQTFYQDNVRNNHTYGTRGYLNVDGVGPTIAFRNTADTANFTSNPANHTGSVTVRLKMNDAHSGYNSSRYGWSNSSTVLPTTWSLWSGAADYNVVHSTPGMKYLHVQAEDNVGNVTTSVAGPFYAYMNNPPTANITWNPSTIYTNTSVQLYSNASDPDGDALTYQWYYTLPGQLRWVAFSNAVNPQFTFNQKGAWQVRVTVSDGSETATSIKTLNVLNRAPVANFTWNPSTVYNNTNVAFTNNSTDLDGDTLTHQWAYQEPGSSSWINFSTAKDPARMLNRKGTWYIRLTVNDGTASDTIIHSINVGNRAPVAQFTHSPTTIYNNTNVTFSNTSTDQDGDNLTHQWAYQQPGSTTWVNFSTLLNPSRTFNIKGTWNIRLTVNDGTTSHSVTRPLNVQNRGPVAAFTHSPTTIYNNTTVSFNNTSSDLDRDTLTHQWAYQAPNSTTWVNFSTALNPTRVFNIKGTWNIRLTVSDGTTTHSVTRALSVINRNPVANFNWNPTTIYNNTSVNLVNASTDADGDTLTYQWAYQQPNSTTWVNFSTVQNPSRIFNIKGTWNVRLIVSDGTTTHSAIKSLTVLNRQPTASITHNPSVVYNDTNVQLSSNASDPDRDTLTYKWEVQKPNTTTWTQISTVANPTYTFNEKGSWTVRVTVSDGETSITTSKVITVLNRPPVADFTHSPSFIYTNTTVTLTNRSADPDGDTLTYQWSYQQPGSTTWVNFSTATNPSRVFNIKGTWNIRLTTNDGTVSHSVTKPLLVLNTPPQVTLTYAPTTIFEGDTVTLTARPTDLDGDRLTVYFEEKVNGTWQSRKQLTNVAPATVVTHTFVAAPQSYEWRVRVVDTSSAVATATALFNVTALEIIGKVSHTADWEQIHAENNHESSQFFSGETFINHASVTNHTISEVTVTFIGDQVNGQTLVLSESMNPIPHPQYYAEIYDESMIDNQRKLANGMVEFVFEARWANGVVKRDIVTVNIVDDIYKAFDMNRTN